MHALKKEDAFIAIMTTHIKMENYMLSGLSQA